MEVKEIKKIKDFCNSSLHDAVELSKKSFMEEVLNDDVMSIAIDKAIITREKYHFLVKSLSELIKKKPIITKEEIIEIFENIERRF